MTLPEWRGISRYSASRTSGAARRASAIESLIEKLPVAAWRAERDGTVIAASAAASKLLGSSCAGGHGTWLKQADERDRDILLRAVRDVGREKIVVPARFGEGVAGLVHLIPEVSVDRTLFVVFLPHGAAGSGRTQSVTPSFVATMSHELRTPLGAVNGYAELLERELSEVKSQHAGVIPPELEEFVHGIQENARRLLMLVNDLFDFSNLESGTVSVRREPVDVNQVITIAASRVAEPLAKKGVDLHLDIEPRGLKVLADVKRLEQVLDNLFSNAVKFTDAGTVIVRAYGRGEEVLLEMTDTGVGMGQDYVERLFEPFLQEDSRLNRRFSGTGLGLALVKRLLEIMGGSIEVESEKGRGSTFRIRLPAADKVAE